MRKLTCLFSASAILLALTSCKKDWNCECTTTYSDGSTSTFTVVIPNQKKKDAETACKVHETPIGSGTTTCQLK